MVFDFASEKLANEPPVNRFARLILLQAIHDKAEDVIFELDQEVAEASQRKYDEFQKRGNPDELAAFSWTLPKAFSITMRMGQGENKLPSAPGRLFEPAMRIYLNAAEIPYWSKGAVSGEFQTRNPNSKWAIKSDNLAREVRLSRLE